MDTVAQRTKKQFDRALAALQEAIGLQDVSPDIQQDVVLLRFQFTAELMPRLLQRILSEQGSDAVLPKDVVRAATGAGLIDESTGAVLLSVIDDRNRMVHDYNKAYANSLFERVTSQYAPALRRLYDSLDKSIGEAGFGD